MVHSNYGVLLVSDIAENFDEVSLARHDLEVSEQETIDDIATGVKRCGFAVVHITEPRDIPAHALKFRDCVVLSVWSGIGSRNRRSLVPAICEAHGIAYVGADPYAALLTADKALSKSVCAEFGVRTAEATLLRERSSIPRLRMTGFPVVLKPLFEGGSIGITQANMADTYEEAALCANELFDHFDQPILCEKFLPGREVSLCIVGNPFAEHFQAIEVKIEGQPGYFDNHLFSMEDKRLADRKARHVFANVTSEIDAETLARTKALYAALGKVDYMRIDGKLHSGVFSCIELSTDPGIGRVSLFANSYYTLGLAYTDMIREILSAQFSKVGGDKL